MNDFSSLIVLAVIAVFVLLRLKNVLGTRSGFEKPNDHMARRQQRGTGKPKHDFDVIDGGAGQQEPAQQENHPALEKEPVEITRADPETANALRAMRKAEPSFDPGEFLNGAKMAYEMILMAYENGDRETLRGLLSDDVYEGFIAAIDNRESQGLTIEARFIGIREARIFSAMFSEENNEADVEVRFKGELISVVRNAALDIVDGSPTDVRRQSDLWTFTRVMGAGNPNWVLTATGG